MFLGIIETAGYYGNLQRGLAELGIAASLVTVTDHPFEYAASNSSVLAQWTRSAFRRRRAAQHGTLRWWKWLCLEALCRASLFVWALASFDVFILGFGVTWFSMPAFELGLMRFARKRIICVFHGADSRPPYLDGSIMATDGARTIADCVALARHTKRRILTFDRLADHIVDHPLVAHYHQRTCVNWLTIGIPYAPDDPLVTAPASDPDWLLTERPIRILHSPSHPEAKGTSRIRKATELLKSRGHPIEYVEITGKPHSEVVRELVRCDFVVDQVYSDTPMAGFATEAAYFGKPAVVGGYAESALAHWIKASDWPPVAYCHPEQLVETMERLIVDVDYRRILGQQARAFVLSQRSPRVVAERFLRLIENRVPQDWTFDPGEIRYVYGCGLSEERVRRLIDGVVRYGGPGSLQVADKPGLEHMLVNFAETLQSN